MKIKLGDELANWVSVHQGPGMRDVATLCTEADSVEGYTIQLAKDDSGKVIMDGDEPRLVRVDGPVSILLRFGAPDYAIEAYRFARWVDSIASLRVGFAHLVESMGRTLEMVREFEAAMEAAGVGIPKGGKR